LNREKTKRTAQRIPANEQLYLRESGDFVLAGVNENAVLACVVNHQAKIGMTLLEVNRCTWRLPVMIRKWMRSNRGAVLELRKAIEPIRSRNFFGGRKRSGGVFMPLRSFMCACGRELLGVTGLDWDRQEKLEEALQTLRHKTQDIDAAAFVSLEGSMIGSVLPSGNGADRPGSMSAPFLSLGARNAMEPDRGVSARVFVENRIRPPGGVQVGR
jgi:predicted regulator of Ras-like GTPase activity (Roadblock/LC7/MglB family)